MAKRYLVHVGDTFETIADKEYGNSALWQKIFNANCQRVKTPEALQPGEQLVIPD